MDMIYRLNCYFVYGAANHGAEVESEVLGHFHTPQEALSHMWATPLRGPFSGELGAGGGRESLDMTRSPLRYDIEHIQMGGDPWPKHFQRFDGALRRLGGEAAEIDDRSAGRHSRQRKPRFMLGDVVGVIAYGRYVVGVVTGVPDVSDPRDDGHYLVDFGIGPTGGVDHVHPTESEILPVDEPPRWLLENLARFTLPREDLAQRAARLRVRRGLSRRQQP